MRQPGRGAPRPGVCRSQPWRPAPAKPRSGPNREPADARPAPPPDHHLRSRSEEHTSELQSLMRISYAVFCLKKKNIPKQNIVNQTNNIASKYTTTRHLHKTQL